jgi:hypothetical protein
VTNSPLLPLLLRVFTWLYMFFLPYFARRRTGAYPGRVLRSASGDV